MTCRTRICCQTTVISMLVAVCGAQSILPSSPVRVNRSRRPLSRDRTASLSRRARRGAMGRLSFESQSITFEEAFHDFKEKEYALQKQLVDAVLLSNYDTANKLKMELHTFAPACSDEVRSLLEKGRGKFIGQCFFHKKNGYRGVIFKPDCRCRMDESWIRMMGVHCLERGADQPFYHCLVDVRDRPGAETTYVAEDNVSPSSDAFAIEHPLLSSLFTPVPDQECYIGTERLERILADFDD